MQIAFTKMHGLGNDFVVIDARQTPEQIDALCDPTVVEQWAHRKRGIGCDQWLVITPGDDRVYASYRVMNADGTEVEQCGNGVRCVAAQLAATDARIAGEAFELGSLGGIVRARVTPDAVCTWLRPPRFEAADLPTADAAANAGFVLNDIDAPAEPASEARHFSAVNVGNPHAVFFSEAPIDDADLDQLANRVRTAAMFPQGVNVGLAARIDQSRLALRVNERGVGETLACGTGAAAAAVAALHAKLVDTPVHVALPGGTLVVDWHALNGLIAITGPAVTAYEGSFQL